MKRIHPNAGERNKSAKLTELQAREIKRSREPLLVLAAKYGMSIYAIWAIRTRKRWKHL
jgi:hypothetical protein